MQHGVELDVTAPPLDHRMAGPDLHVWTGYDRHKLHPSCEATGDVAEPPNPHLRLKSYRIGQTGEIDRSSYFGQAAD
jgi:hypothetical protein